MLVEKDSAVITAATNVYKLVFRNAPPTSVEDYEMYLQTELASISTDGAAISGDPLLSKLDAVELASKKFIIYMKITDVT
jgi:hypothetical protein